MSKRFDTGMASIGDLSSLAVPEPIEGKDVFTCPMRLQKVCNGPACTPEWSRSKDDRSLHVFTYDEKQVVQKRKGLRGKTEVNRYHIIKKALHQEAYCKFYQKQVWAMASEEDVDLWHEEGRDEPDFDYVLKPQEKNP